MTFSVPPPAHEHERPGGLKESPLHVRAGVHCMDDPVPSSSSASLPSAPGEKTSAHTVSLVPKSECTWWPFIVLEH